MAKLYLTTAIPYVNGTPHIGHAMDYLLSDVKFRYERQKGNTVRFQAGTDEHGNKIFQKAREAGQPVEEYVSQNARKFQDFIARLGVFPTDFIRTTDPDHIRRCQKIWKKLSPFIYKDRYEGWYCEGCERFVTEKEVEENLNLCPDHQKPYKKLAEDNYYLKISEFKSRIAKAIETEEMMILPAWRREEMLKLLADSPDVSMSRPKKSLSWGVPVPDDENQVMYVWIDALANYITLLGYPESNIAEFWPAAVQFVGKDILRFHAIIWPAMLLGLGLPLPKILHSHGFVLAGGEKMSKSVGNIVDPLEVLDRHGLTAFRYYFLRHVDTFADADFAMKKFETAYATELANDLGNLVQRLANLDFKAGLGNLSYAPTRDAEFDRIMDTLHFAKALDYIWKKIQDLNKQIDAQKPWELLKTAKNTNTVSKKPENSIKSEKSAKTLKILEHILTDLSSEVLQIAYLLAPFLPDCAEQITKIFTAETIRPPQTPLFPKD